MRALVLAAAAAALAARAVPAWLPRRFDAADGARVRVPGLGAVTALGVAVIE